MLLVIPSIEISDRCCVQVVQGAEGTARTYSIDPADMAVLWRGENAKTLHVVDLDGLAAGTVVNEGILKRIVDAVDTPVQVGGGLRTFDAIEKVLSLGVYRVVVGTAAVEQPRLVERLIKTFGTRKIAIGIDTEDGNVLIEGGAKKAAVTPIELALRMKDLGVSRLVYSERDSKTHQHILPLRSLESIAVASGIRTTCWGGVRSYTDLISLQELEKIGVDSVIVGKPLYENRFPCQALWRINEAHLSDMGPTRRI